MTVLSLCKCVPLPDTSHFPRAGFYFPPVLASPLLIGALADVRIYVPSSPALGYRRSRAFPIPRCRILSWGRLLCPCLRRQLVQIF